MNYKQFANSHNVKVGDRFRIQNLLSSEVKVISSINAKTGDVIYKKYLFGHYTGKSVVDIKSLVTSLESSEYIKWIRIN